MGRDLLEELGLLIGVHRPAAREISLTQLDTAWDWHFMSRLQVERHFRIVGLLEGQCRNRRRKG